MKELYIKEISRRLEIKPWQVENCVSLLCEGATIPFVSRYRKEATGGLDEVQVARIRHLCGVFDEMEKRKATILDTIASSGALTESLRSEIESCLEPSRLEDLYLPYRPRRRTRATAAREAGLEPLSDMMYALTLRDPRAAARSFLNENVPDVDSALQGARDIVAERLSEDLRVREAMRANFRTRRIVCKKSRKADQHPHSDKYRSYFDFSIPLQRIASHQLLALLRAESEGILSWSLDIDSDACCRKIYYELSKGKPYPSESLRSELNLAVEDALERLLKPSISGEVVRQAKEVADLEAVRIFGENLRQLLLAPPVGGRRTLAIDPGFRTGCKVVCLDEQGNLLHTEAIFPHPPANQKVKAIAALSSMISLYSPEVIAIGSGTAGRETEEFVRKVPMPSSVKVYSVSEDGASVYSASDIAREEFPDYDVTVRGAVSIGRRLMDPLSELVKIDPKSLGIGQYQHDVDQNLLKEKLDVTVESCVNSVGVDLNTASKYLLSYVSGIGPALASNIVDYRARHGAFASRAQLLEVKRLGDKAFQQCAGFLRIPGAKNPLDNSAVHPESYGIVEKMASDLGISLCELVSNEQMCARLSAEDYVSADVGLPTVRDILSELRKPSRDPRLRAEEFSFAEDIHTIDDLYEGMILPGIVTNITAFGAFVDIGIHDNGLIHVSQMGVKGLSDPSKVLHLHQKIQVCVISVDVERNRVGLRLVKA